MAPSRGTKPITDGSRRCGAAGPEGRRVLSASLVLETARVPDLARRRGGRRVQEQLGAFFFFLFLQGSVHRRRPSSAARPARTAARPAAVAGSLSPVR